MEYGFFRGAEFYTLDSSDKHLCVAVFGKKNKKVFRDLSQYFLNEEKSEIRIRRVSSSFWNVGITGLLKEFDRYEFGIIDSLDKIDLDIRKQ